MGAGRKLKTHRRNQRWADKAYKKSHLGNEWKKPFAGSSHAKGIVLEKIGIEAKQPNSAICKCARVQLVKNGKKIAAFVPNDGCLNFFKENKHSLSNREFSPQIIQYEIRSYGDLNSGPWDATQVTATTRLHALSKILIIKSKLVGPATTVPMHEALESLLVPPPATSLPPVTLTPGTAVQMPATNALWPGSPAPPLGSSRLGPPPERLLPPRHCLGLPRHHLGACAAAWDSRACERRAAARGPCAVIWERRLAAVAWDRCAAA
ncbi:hypothetical protein OsI_33181 [Oryza sativa Indica Group]|uniref:40S ribosomal protein S23 n=1 Tax=Oryza sativa subsp. indica TaxID=39946 RepID=B8BGD5_ORYSI|nr:hypothetical protein OsI_33181 [Oryza sativa Indica Group]